MMTDPVEVERPLTGEALALADVELVMLPLLATAPADVTADPLLVELPTDDVLAADPPLILLVASFTSWNFSMNWETKYERFFIRCKTLNADGTKLCRFHFG